MFIRSPTTNVLLIFSGERAYSREIDQSQLVSDLFGTVSARESHMGMTQVKGGSAQGHPGGSVQWTFPQRGVRRGHVGRGPARARRDCRDPPSGLVGRLALASVGDRRGQPAVQAGETKVSRAARRTACWFAGWGRGADGSRETSVP